MRQHQELEYYILPEPRETIPFFDRFKNLDSDIGVPIISVIIYIIVNYKISRIILINFL